LDLGDHPIIHVMSHDLAAPGVTRQSINHNKTRRRRWPTFAPGSTAMDAAEVFRNAVEAHRAGQLAEAEQGYRHAIQLQPGMVDAWVNLGAVLATGRRLAEAIAVYRDAERMAPGNTALQFNLGNAYRRAGQFADAVGAYRRAAQAASPSAGLLHNLGLALLGAGDRLEALRQFEAALNLAPNDAQTWYYHGFTLAEIGQTERAVPSVERALALQPNYPEALNLLAMVYRGTKRDADAEEPLRRAIQLNPNFAAALNNYGLILMEAGQSTDAVALFRRALAAAPGMVGVPGNLLLALNYSAITTREEVFEEHRRWAARVEGEERRAESGEQRAEGKEPTAGTTPTASGSPFPIRVGYVSANYCGHPVGAFLSAVLPCHDRAAFHITAYADNRTPDATTEQFPARVDAWTQIQGMSDEAVARRVAEDRIDVLVDLGGHTAGNRLGVFARQPAPVQVTLFAYPNTTGLKAMHYRITDAVADPEGMDRYYTERLVRLPEVAWCYAEPADAPAVSPAPGMHSGAATFGSVNNLAKATDEVLTAWGRILQAAPNSRLIVLVGLTKAGRARVEAAFARMGIAADRIELIPRLSRKEYLDLFSRIDVALDPFPYNGGVTTCDALWMGVPVLTLAGDTYRARQGLCVMSAVELKEFVASDVDEYVRIATECAAEPAGLDGIRAGLRERLRQSPMMDAQRFVSNLEAAFRRMCQEAGIKSGGPGA
jgi:predicted O-linked N-acetylglucosamine transferase (SPINDLY family)